MSDDFAMDLALTLLFLLWMRAMWVWWIREIWTQRPQRLRCDAPTGEPWVKPHQAKWDDWEEAS